MTATIAVLSADVEAARLAEGALRPPPHSARPGSRSCFAIALNSLGTIALLGGIVRSLRRRERPVANLLVGAGKCSWWRAAGRSPASATPTASCSERNSPVS